MNIDNGKVSKILDVLSETYPDAECELDYSSSFELLVATILSAQTTDKKVNKVTEKLFKEYKTPQDFLTLTQSELENYIREIGLYRNKAKNILEMCKQLLDRHNGEVPSDMGDLTNLSGVGRKTANVVLSNAFGIPAIAVDTHVFRVANRIGLANGKNVEETETQLMNNICRNRWSEAHHLLIWHGRRMCDSRKPKCEICPLVQVCNFVNNGK